MANVNWHEILPGTKIDVAFSSLSIPDRRNSLDDDDVEFEHEFLWTFGDGPVHSIAHSPFRFDKNVDLQRFSVTMKGTPPIQRPGTLRMISRIRRSGTQDEWQLQDYPVLVYLDPQLEEIAAADADGNVGI